MQIGIGRKVSNRKDMPVAREENGEGVSGSSSIPPATLQRIKAVEEKMDQIAKVDISARSTWVVNPRPVTLADPLVNRLLDVERRRLRKRSRAGGRGDEEDQGNFSDECNSDPDEPIEGDLDSEDREDDALFAEGDKAAEAYHERYFRKALLRARRAPAGHSLHLPLPASLVASSEFFSKVLPTPSNETQPNGLAQSVPSAILANVSLQSSEGEENPMVRNFEKRCARILTSSDRFGAAGGISPAEAMQAILDDYEYAEKLRGRSKRTRTRAGDSELLGVTEQNRQYNSRLEKQKTKALKSQLLSS
jgi:hypothetical protein